MPLHRSVPRKSSGIDTAATSAHTSKPCSQMASSSSKWSRWKGEDERLQCAVRVGACQRRHLLRHIRCEDPGTTDERFEVRPLLAHLLEPPEQTQQISCAG